MKQTRHSITGSLLVTFLTHVILTEIQASGNIVVPSCTPYATVCDFEFVIGRNATMTVWKSDPTNGDPQVLFPVRVKQDGLYYRVNQACVNDTPLTPEEYQTFNSGDGTIKMIIAVNGKLPGPPIVAYKGQQISVRVTNDMFNVAATLHWHGSLMRGTPWMDGAGRVSHCPIQPGETFHYRFMANEAGTFWYHGHFGGERAMGLAGHLTVLEREPHDENYDLNVPRLPSFESEFHLMVSDWPKTSGEDDYFFMAQGQFYRDIDDLDTCFHYNRNVDGTHTNPPYFYSGIINGKGHVFNPKMKEPVVGSLPIETFYVTRGHFYKFRIVNSASQYPFKISVDAHRLRIIASDGNDLVPRTATHLIVGPGETYDIYIEASDPENLGTYWIRAVTLEYMDVNFQKLKHIGSVEAILQYEGATSDLPSSVPHLCTSLNKCVYINCISKFYPSEDNIECVPVIALRRPGNNPTLKPSDGAGFTEYILAMEVGIGQLGSSINGIKNILYTRPPQIYPEDSGKIECNATNRHCTHELLFPKDHVIQMTFYSRIVPFGSSYHPMHLHGFDFQVVKLGWPSYTNNGVVIKENEDIVCDNRYPTGCTSPRWANSSWEKGNIPDIVEYSSPLKNTIMVPAGGYIVVRLLANNPGYWFLHCHIEGHQLSGMSLTVRNGEPRDMPPLPRNFPSCGSFHWSSEDFIETLSRDPQNHPIQGKSVIKTERWMPITSNLPYIELFVIAVLSVVLLVTCLILSFILAKRVISYVYDPPNIPVNRLEGCPLLDKTTR